MSESTNEIAGEGAEAPPVVVVGVDGSDTARKAADRAATMARALGGRLHLVSAMKSASSTPVTGPGGDEWFLDDADQTRTQLEDMARRWPDLEITVACLEGKPADAIVAEAARVEASLIVVGNRRMQGIARVLGAVADHVAHHAPCDVLIAKTVD